MKPLRLLILSPVFLCRFANAQIPEGTYTNTERYQSHQTLIFYKNNEVYFDLWNNACLISNYKGSGTYHLDKKRIWIEPGLTVRPTYHLSATPAKQSGYINFYITDSLKNPIVGSSLLVKRAGRTYIGMATDANGTARLSKNKIQPGDTVMVLFIGYHSVTYQPDLSSDQHITMLDVPNRKSYFTYLSNHGKGYLYKLTSNSIKINFKDASLCGSPNWWVEFKKVSEPDKTTSNNSSR